MFHYPLDIDLLRLVSREVNNRGSHTVNPINEVKYPFVLNPDTKCRNEDGENENVFLLLLIKSRLENFEQRRMIRRTWGLQTAIPYIEIRRLFLVGVNVQDRALQHRIGLEHQDFDDILQQFFNDHYFNNTLKMMMGLQWAVQHCPGAQFIAFFDDDYYVNIYNLVRVLQTMKPTQYTNSIVSFVWKNSAVLRDKHLSDWALSYDEYPYRYFPPYPTAGSFIMHMSAAERVHIATKYTKYLHLDDVFLGIIAWKLKINLQHTNDLHYIPIPYSPLRYSRLLAVHGFSDVEMLYMVWKEQQQLLQLKQR
ncbi:hypothetical protein LSH36_704g02027 [Paralvinella palmiformis]|uniref:Hexosyltransferase n=1 Tax=Paralvinella palmiformis TaxID=53620 RepID=A0AAD9J1R0_9ANNE|nr:hypothetical protein LSH36_704g02027 [Paralvinella palmiformis]